MAHDRAIRAVTISMPPGGGLRAAGEVREAPGEADLVERAGRGDRLAFEHLYRRYVGMVHGLILARATPYRRRRPRAGRLPDRDAPAQHAAERRGVPRVAGDDRAKPRDRPPAGPPPARGSPRGGARCARRRPRRGPCCPGCRAHTARCVPRDARPQARRGHDRAGDRRTHGTHPGLGEGESPPRHEAVARAPSTGAAAMHDDYLWDRQRIGGRGGRALRTRARPAALETAASFVARRKIDPSCAAAPAPGARRGGGIPAVRLRVRAVDAPRDAAVLAARSSRGHAHCRHDDGRRGWAAARRRMARDRCTLTGITRRGHNRTPRRRPRHQAPPGRDQQRPSSSRAPPRLVPRPHLGATGSVRRRDALLDRRRPRLRVHVARGWRGGRPDRGDHGLGRLPVRRPRVVHPGGRAVHDTAPDRTRHAVLRRRVASSARRAGCHRLRAGRRRRGAALDAVLADARPRDAFTMWHLLARVPVEDRDRVFDGLARLVPPPGGVDRDGIRRGDRSMLDAWWTALGLGTSDWWRTWERPWP